MANCNGCHKSSLGMGAIRLLWLDGTWYCRPCLLRERGVVKCATCGQTAFANNDSFKTVEGQLMCETCMVKRNIAFSTLTVNRPTAVSQKSRPIETLSGALQGMLDKTLKDGEQVVLALNGNSGEAIAVTKERILVLKQGLAAGSLLAKKVYEYRRTSIQGVVCTASNLYGVLVLGLDGAPEVDVRNINVAKKMEHTVTFLAKDSGKFDKVTELIGA